MSSIILNPFQILELNIISAQDLAVVGRSMRTYAVAWVHPNRKLSTRVDSRGRNNPTWNDKFVFRVDEEFLTSDTSGVMIEVYAVHWFKDVLIGRVRLLVGNIIPPPSRSFRPPRHNHGGMRFASLQVRRASGRPQGILNIGMTVHDSSMRSMPLYRLLSTSLVGYSNLIEDPDPYYHSHSHSHNHQKKQEEANKQGDQHQQQHQTKNQNKPPKNKAITKPELRRTKSDTSSMHAMKILKRKVSFREKPNSVINVSEVASSMAQKKHNRKGSASLPSSMVNASASTSSALFAFQNPGRKVRKGRVAGNTPANKGSEVSASGLKTPTVNRSKWVQKVDIAAAGSPRNPTAVPGKSKWVQRVANNNNNNIVKAAPPKNLALETAGKLHITESELGPSPSEVAAAVAEKLKHHRMQMNDGECSAVGGLSLVGSEEGLQSKLERWRMELPPVYDRGEYSVGMQRSSGNENTSSKVSRGSKHRRSKRQADAGAAGGGGLFSCVSNICGCECAIVCGQDSSGLER
ncbi:hypothetical protein SAY87_007524 [Trapa incisa]|uniref:C2 domain-containing protein n=1 Tax=Trapa incisa TaxID=236973 RepID=A0AAN7KGM7_9MYRT|nr:hypothetical protein SAY87_007524 [Trapa incisa]